MAFGIDQITKETPMWAKWMFRIVFLLTTVAVFIISAEPSIDDALKVRLNLYLTGLDMLVYGLSKMFGVKLKKENDNETEN